MKYEEYIIVAALGAGILSKYNRRQAALAFGYAVIIGAFTWLFPSPIVFAKVGFDWWYVACACTEATIIMVAWLLSAPASPYIALCSTINLILNMIRGYFYLKHSNFMYTVYGTVIPTMEALQVVSLYLFSWPVVAGWRLLKNKNNKEGRSHHELRQCV